MNDGVRVPVMIHLPGPTFLKLESMSARKGVGVARLIEAHIDRSLQPPAPTVRESRRSTGTPAEGKRRPWVRLDDAQQRELKELLELNWSVRELAVRYGCSAGTIENWRKRFAAEAD